MRDTPIPLLCSPSFPLAISLFSARHASKCVLSYQLTHVQESMTFSLSCLCSHFSPANYLLCSSPGPGASSKPFKEQKKLGRMPLLEYHEGIFDFEINSLLKDRNCSKVYTPVQQNTKQGWFWFSVPYKVPSKRCSNTKAPSKIKLALKAAFSWESL